MAFRWPTVDEFAVFLRAVGASGPERRNPTPIETFLESHPIAKAFLTTQKPPPVSYATAAYFGVNSFAMLDGSGKKRFVRFRFVPRRGRAIPGRRDPCRQRPELSARGDRCARREGAGEVRVVRADR